MKTRLLLLLLLLGSRSAWAQLPIAESFETDGEGTRYTSNTFTTSTNEYFLRAKDPVTVLNTATFGTGGTATLTGEDGTYFWACEGVRGTSPTTPDPAKPARNVTLTGIDASKYTGLRVTVAAGDPRSSTNIARTTDHLRVQYAYGSGSYITLGEFTGTNAAGTSSWTRVGGSGSTTILTSTFSDHTFDIPTGSGLLYVRIEADYSGSNKELAFDNLRVTGTLATSAAPQLANIESTSLNYAEGAGAVQITNTLTVADPDNTTLSGGTVRISGNFDPTEDQLVFINQSGITGSFNTSTGVLTLSGTASLAAYQAALRSIRYQNTDAINASPLTRTVAFSVSDPSATTSNVVTRTITVTTSLNAASPPPRTEDFDSDGEGTRYGSNTRSALSQGFVRLTGVSSGSASPGSAYASTTTFTNLQGSGYWYSKGSKDILTGAVGIVTLAPVNATGFTNLHFKIKAGAGTGSFAADDFLRFSYNLNNGAGWVVFANYLGGTTNALRLNGNAANPALGTALADLDFALPTSVAGSNISFRVEAADNGGEEIAFDYIQITGSQPPTVTTTTPSGVTATGATLGGAITSDGGATVTDRGIVYSTSNSTPTVGGSGVTTVPNASSTSTFSQAITGLSPGTRYYVAAYASNLAGTGYGSTLSFTTPTTVASITTASATPTNAGNISYTVTFATSVSGLTISNFSLTVSGSFSTLPSVSSVAGSGTTYTVVVNTGNGNGNLTLSLANASGLSPSVSNVPFNGPIIALDKAAPSVAISSSAGSTGSTTSTSPLPFTVTFSESVTGFVPGDLSVANGTVSDFSGSGTTYTFNVTPTTAGTATTVNVAANVAQDAAGNGNTAAPAAYSLTYQQPLVVNAQNITVQLAADGTATLNASSVNNGSAGAGTLTYTIQKIVYGAVAENSTLTLTAPGGQTFSQIRFASFGASSLTNAASTGTDNYRLGSCNAANSLTAAQNSFLGRTSGSMDAQNGPGAPNNNPQLGDPCPGTPKSLAVVAAYSANAASLTYTCANSNIGTNNFVLLTVTDGNGNASTATARVTIVAAPTATISTASPSPAPRGTTVTVSGTNLSGATSLTVNGAAATISNLTSTSFTFVVPAGAASSGNLVLTLPCSQTLTRAFTVPAPTITVAPTTLPDGTAGAAYSQTLAASGGTAPYRYAITAGALPTGLTLTASGTLAGTPATSGTFAFTVTATDASASPGPFTGSRAYTLAITVPTSVSWSGAVSTDWFTAGNWSPNVVPTTSIDALILASAARQPSIGSNTSPAGTRNLTISPGAVLSLSANILNMTADLTNNGTVQATGGTVSFTGSTATQQLGGTTPVGFATLVINKASGTVQLTQSLSVSQALTLTSGTLATATYAVQLSPTATLSETEASYVAGMVRTTRPLAAGSAESFGGLGLKLTPAPGSTPPGSTLVVRTTGTALTGTGMSQSILRYFDIQPTTNTGLNVQLELSYFEHERNGIAAADVRLFKSTTGTGGPWLAQSPITVSGNTVTKTGIADFSIWTLGSAANPLPVELTDFTAQAQGAAVQLRWHTASELHSARFEVERSLDGVTFQVVGTVPAQGTSAAAHSYSLTDSSLPAGAHQLYYRLRQVDVDGSFTYSPVRTVVLPATAGLTLFPNPTRGSATLLGVAAGASVQVLDAMGRQVLRTTADATGTATLVLPVGLASGVYMVHTGQQVLRLSVE